MQLLRSRLEEKIQNRHLLSHSFYTRWQQGKLTKNTPTLKQNASKEKDIILAYNNGKSIAEIEKELNTNRNSIYRLLKRSNIKHEKNISI